ncbi:MAG TPA: hypothetical protein VD905_12290 [Flavobacteriales bacterium]|nr:hypothetical protein [Flavobacteriales bacterium]
MKTRQLTSIAGGVLLAAGTFFPFKEFMGASFNLWNYPVEPQTMWAVCSLALGFMGMLFSFKQIKTLNILRVIIGLGGCAVVLLLTQGAFIHYGIGPWLMLLGGALLVISGFNYN